MAEEDKNGMDQGSTSTPTPSDKATPKDSGAKSPKVPPAGSPKREAGGRPGRPPGARNHPKAVEPIAKARRKAPADYVDTKAALSSLAKDAKTVAEKHNREHPGDKWQVKIEPAGERKPNVPPEMCATIFSYGTDMLGVAIGVDSRPTPEAVKGVGKAWSAASAYIDFDPKWIAFSLAIIATLGACAPMLAESKARKMGLISAGEHIGPHDLANKAKAAAAGTPLESVVK